jgi:hypothetical protein
MTTFAWPTRLKYGALAALAGWLTGWLVSLPFEFAVAWRYVDGHANQLPDALAKGLVVWAAFSLFMAIAGFVPLGLPLLVLVPPRWIVRWRGILIPGVTLAAILVINHRMGLLNYYHVRHPRAVLAFFVTALNFFIVTFALVAIWTYVLLAKRRLSASGLPLGNGPALSS